MIKEIIYEVEAEIYNCNPNCAPDMMALTLKYTSNLGWGELRYAYNTKTFEWDCDTECMDNEFCKAVFNKWIDTTFAKGE